MPGAKYVAHPDRPDFSRYPRERDVFHVQSAIEEERQSWTELIDRHTTSRQHFGISKPVRQGVGRLLNRSRARFTDMITADRNGIPPRHVRRRPLDHVAQKSQR